MKLSWLTAALGSALALGGCFGASTSPQVRAEAVQPTRVASAYPIEKMAGRWGVASYREEKDRARTEAMARSHCRNPYIIERGPRDGVMMHVADDPKLYELTFKGSTDGKNYLGFDAPPGHVQDREIVSFSDDLIVMRFVDPAVNSRYGTYVYVRCPQRA